jgi:hypothetical protein
MRQRRRLLYVAGRCCGRCCCCWCCRRCCCCRRYRLLWRCWSDASWRTAAGSFACAERCAIRFVENFAQQQRFSYRLLRGDSLSTGCVRRCIGDDVCESDARGDYVKVDIVTTTTNKPSQTRTKTKRKPHSRCTTIERRAIAAASIDDRIAIAAAARVSIRRRSWRMTHS